MVVEEITNRPIGARATVKLYRLTLAPYDLVGGGPPNMEENYFHDENSSPRWFSEIYLHPGQRDKFKLSPFFTRLRPYLEPNYQLHDIYGD